MKAKQTEEKEIGRIKLTGTRGLVVTKRSLRRLPVLVMASMLVLSSSLAQAETRKGAIRWQANWIWYEGEVSPRNFYLYAKKEVEVPAPVKRAEFNCSADSRYQLFINGILIGRGPARSDPRWQSYDTYAQEEGLFYFKGK